jgi:hypothetical protein
MESRFNDCPAKEWLQDNLYTHIGARMKSNVMMIPGPSIGKQITNALKIASTPKSEIYFIEESYTRMAKMYMRSQHDAGYLSKVGGTSADWPKNWRSRIHFFYGGVAGYEVAAGLDKPVRFEDLDMDQTMSSMRYLVGHRLLKQSELKSKLRKCMLITSSLRGCDLDKTLGILHRLLNEILGTKAAIWPNAKGKYAGTHRGAGVNEYAPYIEQHGRLIKNGLRLFSYRDSVPMFSCMILYI